MTKPATPVAQLFDAVSATYDAVGVDFFGPIAASLSRHLAPRVGQSWLDIGCGRGAVLAQVADVVGPTGRLVGTDIAPGMIEQARRWVQSAGLGNVRLEVDDAQDPQIDIQPVDTISSSLVLFFLPDPAAAVRRWLPLLVAGGTIGITTFGGIDERWGHVDAVFAPHLPPHLNDARTTGRRGPFASDAGMEELLTEAGFVDVRTESDVVDVRFASLEQWHDFTWSVGQRAMWLGIPEDLRPQVRAEAEARLSEHAAPDGSVTFQQPIRHTLGRRGA